MESPGEYLKRERELRGVTLKKVAEATRIQRKTLEAIEADDLDALPHPTFVKGFIRSYCKELGLDENDAVLRFEIFLRERAEKAEPERHVQHRKAQKRAEKAGGAEALAGLKGTRFVVALAAAGVILAVVFYLASRDTDKAAPPAMETAAVEKAAAPEEKTEEAAAEPAPEKAATPAGRTHALHIKATEVVWIMARLDGGEPFDVTLREGEKIVWRAAERIDLIVGNAGGVELNFDGKPVSLDGRTGEVVNVTLPKPEEAAKPPEKKAPKPAARPVTKQAPKAEPKPPTETTAPEPAAPAQ